MTELQATKSRPATGGKTADGRLFVLELSGGRIHCDEYRRLRPKDDRHRLPTSGWHCGGRASRSYLLDQYGCPKCERRFDRARRPRWKKSQESSFPKAPLHTPKQIHLEKETRQALLVRPRRDARDARQSRRLEDRDSRRHEPGRSPSRAECDEVVRRDHHRSQAAENLLDAERPGQCRTWPHLPRKYRNPARRDRSEPQRHRSVVRRACPSRSISSSILKIACSIGPIAAILLAATPSIAHRSTPSPPTDPRLW